MSAITDKEMEEAIERLANTKDGWLLRRYLQLVLMSFPTPTGALQEHSGRRTLARDLILIMDRTFAKVTSARTVDTADPDAVVIREPAKPVAASGARGIARRVPSDPDEYLKSGGGSGGSP